MHRFLYILLLAVICWVGCTKTDSPDKNDPRLTNNSYCNDPRAVNYNWDFPGKVDNSKCFYPATIFQGTYLFKDSVLDAGYRLADSTLASSYIITVTAINGDYNKMQVSGLHICESNKNDILTINAGRFFKATVDSTRKTTDTTFLPGQVLVSCPDTVTGYLSKKYGIDDTMRISLMVYNDTGVIYHIGTAIKQH